MRIPKISNIRVSRPELTPERKRQIGMAIPLLFAALVGVMSVSSGFHARFNWVPVSHSNIVVDSGLKLVFAIVLTAVALLIVLPSAMGVHVIGHAVAGHFFGMRVLALRVGPVLVTPWAITSRVQLLKVHGWQDVLTGWVQFDDSPLPTWKRQRGWQVAMLGGSGMNLAVSFLTAMFSIVAGGFLYVLLRQAVWLNLAVCVANLIPFVWSRFEFESDGKKLLALFLDEGDGADVLMERMRNEVVVGPIRPASWPRERETAWETSLRNTPSSPEGRAEQVETMVYLFLQGVDRGDSETAWRWIQAMHHNLSADAGNDDIRYETARVMCSLYAARWEKNAETATKMLEQVRVTSGMTGSPWFTVARAAVTFAEAMTLTDTKLENLELAKATAEIAKEQLAEPARLHGVDQMMQGIAQSILGDADVELQKAAYYETSAAKPVIAPEVGTAAA
jgi:hypothetical protein